MMSVVVVNQTPGSGALYVEQPEGAWLVVPSVPDLVALRYALDHIVPGDERAAVVMQLIGRQVVTPSDMSMSEQL